MNGKSIPCEAQPKIIQIKLTAVARAVTGEEPGEGHFNIISGVQ